MKIFKAASLGLFLLLVWVSFQPGRAQANSDLTNEQAIDTYIVDRMNSGHFPGVALAFVKGDQIVYLKGYSQADPSGRTVTPQTSVILYSPWRFLWWRSRCLTGSFSLFFSLTSFFGCM